MGGFPPWADSPDVGAPSQPSSERAVLPDDAVVVRGWGKNGDERIKLNAEEHHEEARLEGREEWAVSCVSIPGLTPLEIVAQAHQIRQPKFRWGMAGTLREAGYVTVEDQPPHALILLPGEPTDETYVDLKGLLDTEEENPHYEERNRRR